MSALCTDLYELRMAASYLHRGMDGPATFSLFVRKLPAHRGFLVAAGLAEALSFLEGLHFDASELAYLRDDVHFAPRDVAALARVRFTGEVWAVPEGTAVFAGEPLLEVTAPIAEAQLAETALLNAVTFQTTISSKAARCRLAAGGAQLIDFSYRRTHGLAAADAVARSCAIAGFAATSNVPAARRYGLTPAGTMAHSYVEAFLIERDAFTAFAADFPQAPVFLVDTYDTVGGVENAIEVIKELKPQGPAGIRLDSGDLGALATISRRLLDAAGLTQVRIVASGGLDEHAIADLVAQSAPIDAFGVGTKMGVSADAPSLDSAYKLVAYASRPVMKLSPGKVTHPGAKQVYRSLQRGEPDVLALRDEPVPAGRKALLVPVMIAGKRLDTSDSARQVRNARRRFEADLAWLPPATIRLDGPQPLPVTHSANLVALREWLSSQLSELSQRASSGRLT